MPIFGFIYSLRKIGGIRFLRIGRLQVSFCICTSGRSTVGTALVPYKRIP